MSTCPLCSPPDELVFFQGKLVFGIWADPAVTPGHALLVTRRHVTDWFAASPAEQQELMAALAAVRDAILERQLPDGFNIGIHIGAAAGQGVPHLHVDVVPRYRQAAPQVADGPAPATTEPADASSDSAPVADPVLDRLEQELEDQAQQLQHQPPQEPEGGNVTQLPGTTRAATADAVDEDEQDNAQPLRALSAVPAPAVFDASEAEPAVEPDEPSPAYGRAPTFGNLDHGDAST